MAKGSGYAEPWFERYRGLSESLDRSVVSAVRLCQRQTAGVLVAPLDELAQLRASVPRRARRRTMTDRFLINFEKQLHSR